MMLCPVCVTSHKCTLSTTLAGIHTMEDHAEAILSRSENNFSSSVSLILSSAEIGLINFSDVLVTLLPSSATFPKRIVS